MSQQVVTPIDFCVALSGPIVDVFWPLFWGSLQRHNNLNGVTFHLINKDVGTEVMHVITDSMKGVDWYVYNLPYLGGKRNRPQAELVRMSRASRDDVGYTCDYMTKNCGDKKWLCISHFDMWFKRDWLDCARNLIADEVGMIGHHCPIMLLNREAYKETMVGFHTMSHFVGVPHRDGGKYEIRHVHDPRTSNEGSLSIHGFDTGELLELELRSIGWKVDQSLGLFNEEECTDEGHRWYHHIGGGGTHYQESDLVSKRGLVAKMRDELGY